MSGSGEEQRETIRPEFNPAIIIDFQGAKNISDKGFLLLSEPDERFVGGFLSLGATRNFLGARSSKRGN